MRQIHCEPAWEQTRPLHAALTDEVGSIWRRVTTSNGWLWPNQGSGDSTGLLENFAVEGRQPSTDGFIKSMALGIVKQGRSSGVRLQDDRATPRAATAHLRFIAFWLAKKREAPPQMRWGPNDSVRLPWILRMHRGPAFQPRPCRGPTRRPVRAGVP